MSRRPVAAKRVVLLSALALWTLYLILTRSVPAGLAETEPEIAVSLNREYPAAVVAYAQQAINGEAIRRQAEADGKRESSPTAKQQAADLASLKPLLRGAIAKDPLNASAFRLLGQIALLESDPKTARRMMAAATALSLEEWRAVDFMLRQSLLANNAKAALYYADALMRNNTSAIRYVAPLVARLAEVPTATHELVSTLAAAPPWRRHVLASLPSSSLSDPRAPLGVLNALKETAHPPTEAEVSGYVNFLIEKKLYALAYSSWLHFIPQEQLRHVAYLFNGSFERRPSGLPFDWMIRGSAETVADVFQRPDDVDQSALFVSFGQARGAFPTIRETVVLRPGSYRFKGSMRGEIRARRGLQWRVSCVEGANAGESQMLVGRFPQWTIFEFDILVPEQNCAAQHVELIHMARSPSEQLASGSVWFDELAVTRRGGGSAAEP